MKQLCNPEGGGGPSSNKVKRQDSLEQACARRPATKHHGSFRQRRHRHSRRSPQASCGECCMLSSSRPERSTEKARPHDFPGSLRTQSGGMQQIRAFCLCRDLARAVTSEIVLRQCNAAFHSRGTAGRWLRLFARKKFVEEAISQHSLVGHLYFS